VTMQEVKDLGLRKSNRTAWTEGCGLAAIQIGVPVRFAWFVFQGKEEILMNPEIIRKKGFRTHKDESCLSIPDLWIDTGRFHYIEYRSDGRLRKAHNLKAIIIQHEIDHMDGVLITDRRCEPC